MRILSSLLIAVLTVAAAFADDLARARTILAKSVGIDSHVDTLQRVLIDNVDLAQRGLSGHIDLPRLREGGMRTPFFALWVPTYYHGAEAIRRTLQLRDTMQTVIKAPPAIFTRMNEEHGFVDVRQTSREFKIGERLRVVPNHVCRR